VKIVRQVQKVNFIKSKFPGSSGQNLPIYHLVEDPLPKDSSESHFIQISDLACQLVSLYVKRNICVPQIGWAKRARKVLAPGDEVLLLDIIKVKLNLEASPNDPYGVVYYPK